MRPWGTSGFAQVASSVSMSAQGFPEVHHLGARANVLADLRKAARCHRHLPRHRPPTAKAKRSRGTFAASLLATAASAKNGRPRKKVRTRQPAKKGKAAKAAQGGEEGQARPRISPPRPKAPHRPRVHRVLAPDIPKEAVAEAIATASESMTVKWKPVRSAHSRSSGGLQGRARCSGSR